MTFFAIKWFSRHALNFSSQTVKETFRKLEYENRKLINNQEHLNFNEICLRENLLPKYTDFKLHDAAASQEDFVIECRRQLTERQIQSKKASIEQIKQDIIRTREQLRCLAPTEVRFAALEMFLKRLMDQHRFNVVSQHDKKLSELYNGTILRKQNREAYVNLSNVNIGQDIEEILEHGMNCHLKTKVDKMRTKVEIEKIFYSIKKWETEKKVPITDEDRLKCELKRFGLKERPNYNKNLITKEQYTKLNELRNNNRMVIRKIDKNNTFVIMDS